jgi:shikimate dehydrogenase/3-dehydroquinate dehydratase type I
VKRALVVEVVRGQSMAALRAARDRVQDAEMVELRLDGVADLDVAGALAGRTKPVIATCRAAWEGGQFDGSETERLGFLAEAVRLGAEYVDVEWRADRSGLPASDRTRIVLSHHEFGGVPADLTDRVRAMQREPAAVFKVAVGPVRLRDCLRLRDLEWGGRPHVTIAMGGAGQVTRLCPARFGSAWTYGGTAAPGQSPVDDLVHGYRVPRQTSATALYAIGGAPLGHSASPAMHNPAFAALGIDAVYVPLETADAGEFLAVAEALGVAGASITAPLKESLFARVPAADDLTRRVGALNTLRRREDGSWEARNFDPAGFLEPLTARADSLAGARVVVLGAGGAARTVVRTLAGRGAAVEVAARRRDRAEALASEFGVRATEWPPATGWDLLVNTTPVGTWPAVHEAPLTRDRIRGGCVYDLVYNPPETQLLRWARDAGAEAIGGLAMLVAQARLQFHWWTARDAPAETMERGARACLARAGAHDHD